MASPTSTTFSLFTVTTLVILLLSLVSYASSSETRNKTASPFEFLEHLKGCHKGDKVQGIKDLKKYLEHFGYLNRHSDNDDFDDLVESAIKNYQINYHLKVTGTLDAKTVSQMMMPRCGVPDIVNGTTSMRSGKKRHPHHHTVAHYSFLQGSPKWPASKYHLTYGFAQGTPSEAVGAVARAFATWAGNTHFSFSQANFESADLKIGFGRRDHGDGHPFDGPRGTIAHAFPPPNGRFHYDTDETWAVGAVQGRFDLGTVALHEIGHLLGLGHSSVEGAVMSPSIRPGFTQSYTTLDDQIISRVFKHYNICGVRHFSLIVKFTSSKVIYLFSSLHQIRYLTWRVLRVCNAILHLTLYKHIYLIYAGNVIV